MFFCLSVISISSTYCPVLVIIPLSFNAESYFTFTEGMLRGDPEAYSFKWYKEIFQNSFRPQAQGSEWGKAAWNSLIIAFFATLIVTTLGTFAAIGLSRSHMPFRRVIMAFLISPMIVPIVITAVGISFFYGKFNLAYTHLGLIFAHAALGTPYVVITVTATLISFDDTLIRASGSLGARPLRTFFKVIMPLITPGVISGALFAFIASFDEVVLIYFLAHADQKTIPIQMWSGLRQQISPSILAVATLLVTFSVLLLIAVEMLRRRSEKLRIRPV